MSDEDVRPAASREAFLAPLEELLQRADPSGQAAEALAVDLDDLVSTLGDVQRDFAALIADRHRLSPRHLRSQLFRLEIALEQDLPWIIADVLPALKELRHRHRPPLRLRRRRRAEAARAAPG